MRFNVNMNREILSQRLKQARLEAGLKQEDLAKCLGVPISAVSILEAGNRKLDVLELLKVAKLYSKPVEWFYYMHDSGKKRRWYDQNSITQEAMDLLRQAPTPLQVSVAHAVIGFLKNGGLLKNDR